MKTRLLLPLLALFPVSACDQPEEAVDAGVVEPSIDGKTDEFSGVENGGTLRFGETVDGAFDEDFQFFEYTFRAREDAQLDIEITQAGSSRDLDTTLFLYRNDPDGGAPSRIAFDNDDGWGDLSRIRDFRLFSEGEYTIVVGTAGATGRGRFRLSLGCASGECEPETPIPECHPHFQAALEECFVEIGQWDASFEIPAHELVGECEDWASDSTEALCPDEDEPLCFDSGPAFDACMDVWETEYVRPATGLQRVEVENLQLLHERVWDSENCNAGEDAGCGFNAGVYSYDGDAPSAAALLAFARSQSEIGPGAFLDQTLEADAGALPRLVDNYNAGAALDLVLDEAGLDFDEARVAVGDSFSEFQWNWGDCEGAVLTATFPTAQRVIVIEDFFCYG